MIRRLATSLVLIVAVAFGARVVFAWHQIARIPRDVVGTVPFQTETGHITYSLATGKGFASPFQRDSGPTAWLAPVYPIMVAGIFKIFGLYVRGSLRYLRMGETAFMEEEQQKAFRFIETHPRMEMKLIAWRFVDFWMGVPDPWRTFVRSDSWLIRGILVGNFVSSLGAVVGAVMLFAGRNAYAIPTTAFPGGVSDSVLHDAYFAALPPSDRSCLDVAYDGCDRSCRAKGADLRMTSRGVKGAQQSENCTEVEIRIMW
jgi:hypothetical protein